MLDKPFYGVETTEDGKVSGVVSSPNPGEGEEGDKATAKTPLVIASPEYFPDKVEEKGKVIRTICILKGQAPGTAGAASCQIIIPGSQCGRTNDIYITVLESSHQVAPRGFFIGIVSTTVETAEPDKELHPGLDLLGGAANILVRFTSFPQYLVPKAGTGDDKIFITESYDATSHFETACHDVLKVYAQVTGEELDLSKMVVEAAEDD